jgi:hypothetical protein
VKLLFSSLQTKAKCTYSLTALPTDSRNRAGGAAMAPVITQNVIIQSPSDRKLYRHLTLANQMQVLLIQDPSMRAGKPTSGRPGILWLRLGRSFSFILCVQVWGCTLRHIFRHQILR